MSKEYLEFRKPTGDLGLLPCPFCGEEENVVYAHYARMDGETEIREHNKRYSVLCCGCMAEIDPGWAQDRVTVQEMWNRREK